MTPSAPPCRPSGHAASGNAFVYILIACVLLGALTYSISRSINTGGAAADLSDAKATIAANSIIAYGATASNALVQLDRMGVPAPGVNFIPPSNAAFNTAPNIAKLYHPEGGGFNLKPLPVDALDPTVTGNPPPALYIGRFNNVEWTPSTANDIVFSAWGIRQEVCAALNKQLLGSATIPSELTTSQMRRSMVDTFYHGSSNVDPTAAACPSCDGKPALCLKSTSNPPVYGFYQVLVAR